jgi:uncharacterized protein with HEPN domain
MPRTDRDNLEAILRDIGRILADASEQGWTANEMAIDAIAKRLEDIGDQACRVSAAALAAMPSIPWPEIKGIRIVLARSYDDLDVDVLRDAVENDLPPLKRAIEDYLGVAE